MAIMFLHLCDEILASSSPYTPFDSSKKPLSTLLNEMTTYVATITPLDNDDESIIFG